MGAEFLNWRNALDLPDPEELLAKPNAFKVPERGDRTFTILASVSQAVVANMTKERYLAAESCIDSEYIFERNGKVESRKAKHWIYTVAEIRRMLKHAGLVVKEIFGSLDRKPYELGSTELFVVSEARP